MKRMWSRNEIKNQVNVQLGSGEVPSVKADEIIENMSGYAFSIGNSTGFTYEGIYAGAVKTGNKLTLVVAINITKTDADAITCELGRFTIPQSVYDKLFPTQVGTYEFLDVRQQYCAINENSGAFACGYVEKVIDNKVRFSIDDVIGDKLTVNTKYYARYELTLLLSDNLIPSE